MNVELFNQKNVNTRMKKKVICADAVEWLLGTDEEFQGSIFCGIPDVKDVSEEWLVSLSTYPLHLHHHFHFVTTDSGNERITRSSSKDRRLHHMVFESYRGDI